MALFDGASWVLALFLAAWSRYDWTVQPIDGRGLAVLALVAVAAQWLLGAAMRTYRGRYFLGTIEQASNVALVAAAVALVLVAFQAVTGPALPRSVPLTAALAMIVIAIGTRVGIRIRQERRARVRSRAAGQAVIVFGAGEAGRQLVRSMLAEPACGCRPVALLDDDPDLRRRSIHGVEVKGDRSRLAAVAEELDAGLLVIAVPSRQPEVTKELATAAIDAGLSVKVVPPLSERIQPWIEFTDLRDVDINDLLGRPPVDTDVAAIAGFLRGKRVLVTGAGGSIGSELCRQIHSFGPAELMMLDRDESALHAVQLSITGRALLDSGDVILADIRDAGTVHGIFRARRPEVVFHAAALKHLPMLEQYPVEAWKTNVLGTLNVLDAAEESGVERFVNISTDKAANPVSNLGRSKRIGELLVAAVAERTRLPYVSVRFGNVLGSRGSVLTTFSDQIVSGRSLTITHPDVTRFFMTIPEAVELVIQAAVIGRSAETLVLDMGTPVRIVDLARQLMVLAGREAPIVFTGLRGGEKLHEELFGDGECDARPFHPAISHVTVPALDEECIRGLTAVDEPEFATKELKELSAPTADRTWTHDATAAPLR
ncbi:MAG: polysaccharide biosynthesis protein [Pseudonocardia sp.]|nr:polysaccharide biosynthesis protein [Pseudonocardia sp.]